MTGTADSGEIQESPTSETSDSKGSGDANDLLSRFEAGLKRIDEIDAAYKTFQQGKDRGANEAKSVKSDVAELKRKIAEIEKLKKAGLNEDDAIEELNFRDEVRTVRQQLSGINQVQSNAPGKDDGLVVEKARTLQQYGLSENDPDVAAALGGRNLSPFELEHAALKVAYQRANKPQPDASAASSVNGGPPSRPVDNDAIHIKIADLSRNYTQNRVEIENLQKQLK